LLTRNKVFLVWLVSWWSVQTAAKYPE